MSLTLWALDTPSRDRGAHEVWKALGERAAAAPGSVLEIAIPQGGFSEPSAGTFAVVVDRDAIRPAWRNDVLAWLASL